MSEGFDLKTIGSNCFTGYNKALHENAKKLSKNMTHQESKLWFRFLKPHPLKWYRQRIINRFIVDFYCSQANLVIEIDGSQHFTEQGLAYDKERTAILEAYNLTVLRYTNKLIDYHFNEVCQDIENHLPIKIR